MHLLYSRFIRFIRARLGEGAHRAEVARCGTQRGDGDAARPASPQPKLITRSKLNLVDLAGSEKWQTHQMSRMSGKQVSEMTAINRSLSALGNCIRALSESGRSHIPFRDSKLTRLLADSLGGNTRTAFIVTLSPALEAADESRMSLQFASRAKRVAVHASVNKTVDDASQLLRLERKIASLRNELRQASRGVRPNQPLGRGDRGGGRGGGARWWSPLCKKRPSWSPATLRYFRASIAATALRRKKQRSRVGFAVR